MGNTATNRYRSVAFRTSAQQKSEETLLISIVDLVDMEIEQGALFSLLVGVVQVLLATLQYHRRWQHAMQVRRRLMCLRFLANKISVISLSCRRSTRHQATLLRLHEMGAIRRWWVYPRSSAWWLRWASAALV